MGYRSDVAIALSRHAYMERFITNEIPRLLREQKPMKTSKAMYWYFTGVKWYDDFGSINEVNGFLDLLNNEHESAAYAFLRIGEEDDDVEIHGDCYEYDLLMVRYIQFPTSLEQPPTDQ